MEVSAEEEAGALRMAEIARKAELKAGSSSGGSGGGRGRQPEDLHARLEKTSASARQKSTEDGQGSAKPRFLTKPEREAAALARLHQRKQGGPATIDSGGGDLGGGRGQERPRHGDPHGQDRDRQRREHERERDRERGPGAATERGRDKELQQIREQVSTVPTVEATA